MRKLLYILAISTLLYSCDKNNDDFLGDGGNNNPPTPPTTVNGNANTISDVAAKRLEMPHVDASLFFAPHYVDYESRHIMNIAMEWNASMRHPSWVAFSWDSTTSQDNVERGSAWKWDPMIPDKYGKVTENDHKSDGFDKGHLCASEDRVYCTEANDQTFYYSNISPQIASFNQQFWARLEAKVQSWGKKTQSGIYDTIYVCKGGNLKELLCNFTGTKTASDRVYPTTDERGFSKGGMAVPTYYFMAILTVKNGNYNAIAFYVPHIEGLPSSPTTSDYQGYVTTITNLEALTGIDFFCNLPDDIEKKVEERYDLSIWAW